MVHEKIIRHICVWAGDGIVFWRFCDELQANRDCCSRAFPVVELGCGTSWSESCQRRWGTCNCPQFSLYVRKVHFEAALARF